MHELSLCQALLDQVEREVHGSGHSGRVVRLTLSVGRLSGVHVHALRFAFDVLSVDSIVDGAELEIREPPARCCCRSCGTHAPIVEIVLACQSCGSSDVTIRDGRDLLLESIDLEE